MTPRTAVLLHGSKGSETDYFWFGSFQDFLRGRGYDVWWPLLPHTEFPDRDETVAFLSDHRARIDGASLVVAHSSGCPLFLSFLEREDVRVDRCYLIAGFYVPVRDRAVSHRIIERNYDWPLIRSRIGKSVLINSDDDPWGCDDVQARPVAKALGADFHLIPGGQHLGSARDSVQLRRFPFLEQLIAHDDGAAEPSA